MIPKGKIYKNLLITLSMENSLYPLKFSPIYKKTIWGGESWEISPIENNISVISNGFLAGNNLEELIEVYMGDLVGDKVYEKFGNMFPLLIKFIDAHDDLSVQVHPNDELALSRHNSFGKTEMWYVLECEDGAKLVSGFNKSTSKEEYLEKLSLGSLQELLNYVDVKKNDVFFIPAGRVHAIGKGIRLAEIQQASDITYRIFDYNRKDSFGKSRELHTSLATDAIDYNYYENVKSNYKTIDNKTVNVVDCQYFTTNVFSFSMPIEKDFPEIDSFIIYICTLGECKIECESKDNSIDLKSGEIVLIPAMIKNLCFYPQGQTTLLEVYIK